GAGPGRRGAAGAPLAGHTRPGARRGLVPALRGRRARRRHGQAAPRALPGPCGAGERRMIKVKHARTADCVVAGFRWHKKGPGTMVGSLLLGLYDDDDTLHHVGVAAAFTNTVRQQLVAELAPLRVNALAGHPWSDWAEAQEDASATGQRLPGATSRWKRGTHLH